jgi:glycosyltransferase involved in cell wall biosynthesis
MRTKILYLITKNDIGGAQKYVYDLATNINTSYFDAKILYGGVEIPSLSNRISPPFLINDWRALFQIMRILRQERPHIIHLNSSKAGVVGTFAVALYNLFGRATQREPIHIIFTAHGWVFNPSNSLPCFLQITYVFLHRIAAFFQNTIINVSHADHEIARTYKIAPEHKLVTIYNGIDPNIPFLTREEARKELIQKIRNSKFPKAEQDRYEASEIQNSWNWIGSIGRLVREKNYELLIHVAEKMLNTNFFIIGEGYEKDKLTRKINGLKLDNRFFIIPPTGNDAAFLKAFDIFTLTSQKEGLPYTLLEARAAGIPIAVTNIGGMPEVITEKSIGTVFKAVSPPVIAETLLQLLITRRTPTNTNTHTRLRTQFNRDSMIAATEKIYRAIV